MNEMALAMTGDGPATVDILADFGKFLRLHTAEGDASEHTIRSYFPNRTVGRSGHVGRGGR